MILAEIECLAEDVEGVWMAKGLRLLDVLKCGVRRDAEGIFKLEGLVVARYWYGRCPVSQSLLNTHRGSI